MRAVYKMTQPRYELLYLSIILVFALLCRLYPINRGLGQDELYTTIHFVRASSVLRTISSNDAFNNHIAYSLMARFSEVLFGRSEWAIRLPAFLLGLGSLYFFFILSRSILTPTSAIVATFMLALSPPHIAWSIAARGYSGMIFFTILSSYLYIRLLYCPAHRDAFFFVIVSVLGIYIHIYSIFVILIQFMLLLPSTLRRYFANESEAVISYKSFRMLRASFLAIAVLSFICYLPVAMQMSRDIFGRGHSAFNLSFPWSVIAELSGTEQPQIAILILIISVFGWFSLLKLHSQEVYYFTLLFTVPLLIMWLSRPFDLYPRFFAYWLPYYIIFFMAGLNSFWHSVRNVNWQVIGYLLHILTILIVVIVLHNWSVNWQNFIRDEGYREASRALLTDAEESAALCAIGGARSVWRYYVDRPIVTPVSVAQLQELGRTHTEVRCIYYEASWQSAEQTEIARFLLEHSSWSRVKGFILFILKFHDKDTNNL